MSNVCVGMKTSAAIRESDLKSLLKSTPTLTRNHTPATLPHSITSDVRYHVLTPESRDSIIHDHLSRLPEDASAATAGEQGRKEEKSALALREREMAVRKERMQRRGEEERAKWMLRQEEEEIERAKMVGKKGLAQHLKGATE